jgi:hypothetical protein
MNMKQVALIAAVALAVVYASNKIALVGKLAGKA